MSDINLKENITLYEAMEIIDDYLNEAGGEKGITLYNTLRNLPDQEDNRDAVFGKGVVRKVIDKAAEHNANKVLKDKSGKKAMKLATTMRKQQAKTTQNALKHIDDNITLRTLRAVNPSEYKKAVFQGEKIAQSNAERSSSKGMSTKEKHKLMKDGYKLAQGNKEILN